MNNITKKVDEKYLTKNFLIFHKDYDNDDWFRKYMEYNFAEIFFDEFGYENYVFRNILYNIKSYVKKTNYDYESFKKVINKTYNIDTDYCEIKYISWLCALDDNMITIKDKYENEYNCKVPKLHWKKLEKYYKNEEVYQKEIYEFRCKSKENEKYFQNFICAFNILNSEHEPIIKSQNINVRQKEGKWVSKSTLNKKVEILSMWKTDYGDIASNAILYKNKMPLANIVVSFDENLFIEEFIDENTEFNIRILESLIFQGFDDYLKLPKISNCSKLLQNIFDCVSESDSSMCHVDDLDWMYWKENYNFTDDDIITLKKEIIKFNLDEVISINENGYKFVGYGDLQTRFNDNRNLHTGKIRNNKVENINEKNISNNDLEL